jgi:hypothetical protein
MRFIIMIVALVALTMAPVYAQTLPVLTEVSAAGAPDGSATRYKLGTIADDSHGNLYMYVRNVGTVRAVGDVVTWSVTNSVTNGGMFEVKVPATGDLNLMAGVCMGALPATTGEGWIQIRGYNASISMYGGTDIVLGDSLECTNGQVYVIQSQSSGTVADFPRHIIALQAYADGAAALKAGYINCY